MTHALRSLWLAGHEFYDIPLAADGMPLPSVLGQARAPPVVLPPDDEDDPAESAAAHVLGPGRTTLDPALFVCKVQLRPTHRQLYPNEVDARRLYWPPPLACVSLEQPRETRQPRPPVQPSPEGVLDAPLRRLYHPMDTTGMSMLVPDRRLNYAQYAKAPKDKCYYVLPMRAYRFIRFITGPKNEATKPRPRKVARTKKAKSGGGGIWIESVLQATGRKNRRETKMTRLLKALDAMGPRSRATARLLNWQNGGVSFDGEEFEFDRGFPEGSVAPQHVLDQDGVGAQRRVVFGVSGRALAELGLFSNRQDEIMPTLCMQLGLGWLPRGRARARDNLSFSQADLKTLLFPPVDSKAWKAGVLNVARATRRVHLEQTQNHTATFGNGYQNELVAGGLCCATLQDASLTQDLLEVSGKAVRKGPHAMSGWNTRVVPVFMLPFFLTQPFMYASHESQQDPYFACLHLANGLRLLSNAEHINDTSRAAAWHDNRLLLFTMSLVWKQDAQEVSLNSIVLDQLHVHRQDMTELTNMTLELAAMVHLLMERAGIDPSQLDKEEAECTEKSVGAG